MRPSAGASTIRARLTALRSEVLAISKRHGASNLRLFGSVATGHETTGSDLDLLIELDDKQTLLGLISLRQELESLLDCTVDITEVQTLHPLIRSDVLKQAVVL